MVVRPPSLTCSTVEIIWFTAIITIVTIVLLVVVHATAACTSSTTVSHLIVSILLSHLGACSHLFDLVLIELQEFHLK